MEHRVAKFAKPQPSVMIFSLGTFPGPMKEGETNKEVK
jgi:hypothetical protein